jgi:hypothetical protein
MATRRWLMAALVLLLGVARSAGTDDFERAPIRYSEATPENCVTRLQARIDAGRARPVFDARLGYLPWVLDQLEVPRSSQMLVFSKTSLQRSRIAPKTPRAVYFGDDVYVGFCQNGPVMEISAVDPLLGAVFYTLDQEEAASPKFMRHGDNCLLCHGSSQTRGIPGHLVRSVYPDRSGLPILSAGSHRVDHTTPLERRWGGWYVTGTHGPMTHLGNHIVRDQRPVGQVENLDGLNVTSLADRFDATRYLTPHSDIVALMVLEHQTEMHNLITRAGIQTRLALYDEAELNRELGRSADYRSETTTRRIRSVCEPLVKYMLFSGEAKLTHPVKGTAPFAQQFAQRGPRDGKGRSLRDLDLQTRLFKYPCSYLVYTPAFNALPPAAKEYTLQRLYDVLKGTVYGRDFDHLNSDDCRAIYEILIATKKDLPDYWHEGRQ